MIVRLLAVLIILAACAGSGAVRAAVPLEVAGGVASLPLDGHLEQLDDPTGRMEAGEAARASGFRPFRPELGTGTRWYRFTLRRPAGAPADWVLAFGEPDIDDVRLYVPDGRDGYTETRLGRRVPAAELALAATRHVVALTLPEDRPVTYLLRLSTPHKLRFEEAALWRPAALMFAETRDAAAYGLRFGGLAVVAVVYALFGLWLRDGVMLLYAAYVVTTVGRGLTHTGVAALLFPASGETLNHLLGGGGMLGGLCAFALMWDRVLGLRHSFPRLHLLYLAMAVTALLALPSALGDGFSLVAPLVQAAMLAVSLGSVAIAASLAVRRPKDVLLRFYLCAFLPFVVTWAVQIGGRLTPLIPIEWGRALDVGATSIHVVILSVALAYRLKIMQRQQMQTEVTLAGERMARQRMRTFVDMATHEFKTPLAVIDSAVQMLGLLTAPGRPEITGRIATIRRAVQRLVNLIETCLAGERDEAMAVRPRPVSPHALVVEAAERNHAPDWPDVVVETADLPAACMIDPDLMGIALDALIDNARRYGGSQPVELSARGGHDAVVFAVEDSGGGVPEASVPFVFDKYYRCPSIGPIPGTGIGLYLVKTIAELHGGSASYRPREGGGATFAVAIPVTAPARP